MASAVDFANGALYRVGSSIRITSLDESVERTEPVRQAGFWYPLVRDQVLASAPWGFARKWVSLAQSTDTVAPGWTYAYQYPSDCIQAVAVCDAGGVRGGATWFSWWAADRTTQVPKIPFQIGASADGASNVILTDISPAYLYYIFRQTQTAVFSPLFGDALMWKLGAELGSAVNANPARVTRCLQMYQPTLDRAMALMMNEAQADPAPDSPSISVRSW